MTIESVTLVQSADSLMSRKLRALASEKKDKTAFRTVGESDYTDLIINVKFKQDIMIPDKKPKMGYDTEQSQDCATGR